MTLGARQQYVSTGDAVLPIDTEKSLLLRGASATASTINADDDGAYTGPWLRMRYVVAVLIWVALTIVYILRVNLSIAIIPMSAQFGWSPATRGLVLSSFFWGYIVTQLPGGWMATRFGGKYMLLGAVLGASAFTAILPVVVTEMTPLIVVRVLTGIFEAPSYPTVAAMLSRWFPPHERSSVISSCYSGAYIGTIIAMLTSPLIIERWGWPALFYINATLGGVWGLVWIVFGASSAADSRFISVEELAYIKRYLTSAPVNTEDRVPWRQVFSTGAVWSVVINSFCGNWSFYILLTWLPAYMHDELGFDLQAAGFASEAPYVASAVCSVFVGFMTDFFVARGAKLLLMRKLNQSFGLLTSAALFVTLCGVRNSIGSVAIMIAISGISSFTMGGAVATPLDISQRFSGIIVGISNTAATIPGIVGVLSTGYILQATNNNWCVVFSITAGVHCAGWVCYMILAKAHILIS